MVGARIGSWVLLAIAAPAPAPDAETLFSELLRAHDPQGRWAAAAFNLQLRETRPDGTSRERTLEIDNAAGSVAWRTERDGRRVDVRVHGEAVDARLDGRRDFSAEEAERFRLSPELARRMRNYYLYLYGLPMKWRDPGTHLDPQVVRQRFGGRDCWRLRIHYDPEVGGDVWYAWIDPDTFTLVGTGFHHDEAARDGEHIVFEGLADVAGMRLPRRRAWTVAIDDRYLGTDEIVDP